MIELLAKTPPQADGADGVDRRRGRAQGDRRQGTQPRRHDDGGVLRHLRHRSAAGWSISACWTPRHRAGRQSRVTASRPDIVDRNGEVLATDIKTASLFAEPRRIVDADEVDREAVDRAARPRGRADLPQAEERRRLRLAEAPADAASSRTTSWQLGLPGIGFRTEKRRFYPGGATASHILGLTNIDNQGIAGMEKYIDDQGLADLQASGLADRQGPGAGQAVDRPARPAHRARRDRRRRWSATTRSPPARSCSTSRPARSSRWPRCRTSIRTTRTTRWTRTASTACRPASSRWARPSRASPRRWRSIPAR